MEKLPPQVADNDAYASFNHLSIRTAVESEMVPFTKLIKAGVSELADRSVRNDDDAQVDLVAAIGGTAVNLEFSEGERALVLKPCSGEGYDLYAAVLRCWILL